MRGLRRRQSELSTASAAFYAAGGLISLLIATVFRDEASPLNTSSLVVAALAGVMAVAFLVAGDRARPPLALAVMCASATLVLVMVVLTPLQIRAMNSGLLFYTFIIYLVWFGPMWLARCFGYSWLVAYCAVLLVRFSADLRPYLATLTLTSVVLGELIGRYKSRLETVSLTDPLCGVWNKRGFAGMVERARRAGGRTGQPLALLYIDIDELKLVNDTQGHAAGDRMLRDFSEQLGRLTRPQDVVARLGGDEFALLLPGADAARAGRTGDRLRAAIVGVSWSFGVAELGQDETADELVARADRMMMDDKQRRRRERAAPN